MPVKTHSDCPGTRLPLLTGRTAMQSVCDSPSLSAFSGPDSLTLATATDQVTAAQQGHSETQSSDARTSPPRPTRRMVCPGAPKKRLLTNSFSARTAAATNASQWPQAAQAAPLRQDSHSDRQANVMSKLVSRANPIHSAQGLLDRLNQMGATAVGAPGACTSTITEAADSTCALDFGDGADNPLTAGDGSVVEVPAVRLPQTAGHGPRQGMTRGALATCCPAVGPRMKSDTTLDETQPGSFQTAAGTSHSTQEALKGIQQDHAPVRADDPVNPVNPVLKRAASQSLYPPSLVHSHSDLNNSSSRRCISSAAPEELEFTQGSSNASTHTWNRACIARPGSGVKPCALPAGVLQDGTAGQDAGLLGSIVSLTPASQFFPSHKQQLFVTSFNLPMDPSPPPTLRPFFNLPWL